MPHRFKTALLVPVMMGGLLLSLTACQVALSGPRAEAGERLDARIEEASGLAASSLVDGRYWTHNDSRAFYADPPTQPILYAIGADGVLSGELWLEGLKPYDWEAVSAFRFKGKPYLMIADMGDNRARRGRGIRLDAVEEPGRIEGELRRKPAWTLRLSYSDGPRDAESMAVDVEEGMVYVLSKRDTPPRLYRAPLLAGKGGARTLEFMGDTVPFDAPLQTDAPSSLNVLPFTHQPTDMAFAPDRREVAVLTYAHVYVFGRMEGQTWLEALRGRPKVIDLPGAQQYEGISYTRDGKGWVIVQEGEGSPVLRIGRPAR